MPQRDDSLTRQLGISRRRRMRNLFDLEPTQAALVTGSESDGPKQGGQFEIPGCATIVIPASSIDATLTGWVVPYPLSEAPDELWADSIGTGKDLYVLDSLGVRIPAHPFLYNGVAKTGFLFFRAPTLSSSVDNTFLLCWGDSVADFVPQGEVDLTSLITNPGAETGDLTGWTSSTGVMLASAGGAHSGSFRFQADSLTTRYFQDIDVPAADEAKVDSGEWVARIRWWQSGEAVDYGTMGFTFLDAASAQLDEEWKASGRGFSAWTQREFRLTPPSGTRKIRIWMDSRGNSGLVYAEFDDIELALENVDINKQWGVWQDYIGVGLFESGSAVNFGPGEPTLNIESFGGNSPVYSALTMGAGGGVTTGSLGAYRGFMGCPLVTNKYTQGVTIVPSNVAVRMVAIGFAKLTSASEAADESQWLYHAAGGDYRIFDDLNSSLSSVFTLVNSTAYRAHCIYDGTTARRIYLDGIEKAEDAVIGIASDSFSTLFLANEDQSFTERWEGGIGYVWMRRGVVVNAWIKAEHLALSDPVTFFNATVFSGGDGAYIRHDGTKWENVTIAQLRDDLQANAPYGELAVANEWTAEQTYDDGSALPAAFGTYTIQTTSPTTEDYPDGTLWYKTTSKIELWLRTAGTWLRLLQDAAFRRITEDGSLRVTEAGDQRVMETVPVLLEVTPKYIKLLPGYSFGRTGGGTDSASYVDKNGIVQFTTDIRNSHYIGGVQRILLEGASTNLVFRSEDLATLWTFRGTAAVVSNDTTAPDGKLTADKVTGINTVGNDFFQGADGFSNSSRCDPSFWIRRISTSGTLNIENANASTGRWQLDISLLSNDWEWIDRAHPALTINSEWVSNVTGSAGPHFFAGAGGPLSFHIWGIQEEDLPFSTSYIPTAGAAVTRNADSLSVGFPHVPQESTWYVKGVELGTGLDSRNLYSWAIGDGSTARLFSRRSTGTYRIRHIGTAGDKNSQSGSVGVFGDTTEVRQVFNSNGSVLSAISINGGTEVEGTTSAAVSPIDATWSDTVFHIGESGAAALPGYFAFESIRITQGINSMEDERAAAL